MSKKSSGRNPVELFFFKKEDGQFKRKTINFPTNLDDKSAENNFGFDIKQQMDSFVMCASEHFT